MKQLILALLLFCWANCMFAQNTNTFNCITYGSYSLNSHQIDGGGVALAYTVSKNVVTGLRLQYFDHQLAIPQLSVQLQLPYTLANHNITPFVVTAAATPLGSKSGVIGITGLGLNLQLYKQLSLICDYEIWSGAVNDKLINTGLNWSF